MITQFTQTVKGGCFIAGMVFGGFCLVSFMCALATGNLPALGDALFSGAEACVELFLTLLGAMCLWCGVLEVLRDAGVIGFLENLLSPLLVRLFPETAAEGGETGMAEISASLAANLLGIGNAATPLGLAAMEKLEEHHRFRDMTMFVVLNTAPPALLPTTLLSLRHAAGSSAPARVLPAVWIVSMAGAVFAVLVTGVVCGKRRTS